MSWFMLFLNVVNMHFFKKRISRVYVLQGFVKKWIFLDIAVGINIAIGSTIISRWLGTYHPRMANKRTFFFFLNRNADLNHVRY